MTATTPIAVAAALLALTLAGCTGSFNVDQTEPIRVQLEGQPQTVTVRDTDAEAKRVEVATDCETACDHEEVEVQLEVHKVSSGPCKILVTIQGDDGQTITSRVIDVDVNVDQDDGDDGDDGTTSGNTTGNATTTSATTATGSTGGSDVTIQNIIVNVKGNKNIIVLTQAQEGSADVNVQAIKASGNADVDSDVDQGGDDDDDTSSTTTSSSTMTTTYP